MAHRRVRSGSRAAGVPPARLVGAALVGASLVGASRVGPSLVATALVGAALASASLAGCHAAPPQALGTLEYDRITVPAPASERIVEVSVREGQRVEAGALLVRLDDSAAEARYRAPEAEVARQREALAEAEVGPRREDIAQARADLATARATATNARSYHARLEALGREGAAAPADVDSARAAAESAEGRVRAAESRLTELERGTRIEEIAQARAALEAAEHRASEQAVYLEKLSVRAPRDAEVDSLPYRLGDQPPVGAPLAVLLVGEQPYARVYVPEPIRARVRVGSAARVHVDGRDAPLAGRVRMIRTEPAFTPYYALIGDDAARLSYLAEIELTDPEARGLPAGMPVRAELGEAAEAHRAERDRERE